MGCSKARSPATPFLVRDSRKEKEKEGIYPVFSEHCVCVSVSVCVCAHTHTFSHSVVSNSLQPYGLQLTRFSAHGSSQAIIWKWISSFRGSSLTQGLNLHLLHWQADSPPPCQRGLLIKHSSEFLWVVKACSILRNTQQAQESDKSHREENAMLCPVTKRRRDINRQVRENPMRPVPNHIRVMLTFTMQCRNGVANITKKKKKMNMLETLSSVINSESSLKRLLFCGCIWLVHWFLFPPHGVKEPQVLLHVR